MEFTPLWTLIPTFVAIVFGLTLLVMSHRYKWSEAVSAEPNHPIEATSQHIGGDLQTNVRTFFETYRREFLLAGVFLGVLIFSLLSAPTQMTGEIATAPNVPGRPFYFIHWQRNHLFYFYHETASISNLLTGLLALALTILAAVRKSLLQTQTGLLWSFMSLAGSAQWMLSTDNQRPFGVLLYVMAGSGFLFWSLYKNQDLSAAIDETRPIPFKWEITFLIAIVALAAFSRLSFLKTIPYGIEGDEAKWTAEVVWLGLRGEPDTNGLYHRDALPGSFYMQTLFHKIMGPSLFAARFEVAFFSIIATLIFYLLLRQITAIPLALLASWFLSSSIFDISASRLANVESHVKIWPILALALLAWALHKKHWTYYAISGITLAIGLLTYDTVWPLGLVMLLIVIIESVRQKDTFPEAMRNIMAMLTPTLLVLPLLIPYITSRLSYYELDNKGWGAGFATLWEHAKDVGITWYITTYRDFLYNRNGPLLNAFLLPWLTFGITAVSVTLRRRLSFWTFIWALLFILPVPIAAYSPFGRVYYPGLPAIYILIALGMYVFTRESLRALGNAFRPLIVAIAVTVLVWIPLFNLYIYFNEVDDFEDRQMRREVAEMVKEVASEDNFIVLASVPRANEALNNEFQMIELFMMEKLPADEIAESYQNVPLENVLQTLTSLSERPDRSIVLDNFTPNDRPKRDDLTKALETCYPQANWVKGNFFSRIDLTAEMLANPSCISTNLTLSQETPGLFSWKLSEGTAEKITMSCEILQVNRAWIEAETLTPYPGWQSETVFAADWNGEGFLMDNYGSEPTLFDIEINEDKPVYLWVRYYKRELDNSPPQIILNDQTISFANIEEEQSKQWVWEKVGPFNNAPIGINTAALSRPYLGDPLKFMAIFIDTIVATTDADLTPTDDHYIRLPLKTFTLREESAQGNIVQQLEPGSYRCTVEATSKDNLLVDSFGMTPVRSNPLELEIKP